MLEPLSALYVWPIAYSSRCGCESIKQPEASTRRRVLGEIRRSSLQGTDSVYPPLPLPPHDVLQLRPLSFAHEHDELRNRCAGKMRERFRDGASPLAPRGFYSQNTGGPTCFQITGESWYEVRDWEVFMFCINADGIRGTLDRTWQRHRDVSRQYAGEEERCTVRSELCLSYARHQSPWRSQLVTSSLTMRTGTYASTTPRHMGGT